MEASRSRCLPLALKMRLDEEVQMRVQGTLGFLRIPIDLPMHLHGKTEGDELEALVCSDFLHDCLMIYSMLLS